MLLPAGARWRLCFQRRGDRFAHRVEVSQAGEFRPALESVEGEAADIWPPSPPWQELHMEQRTGGGQVALLVGRAGRSHWSMSIEPGSHEIVFDAACRLQQPPAWLGSSYRLLLPPEHPSPADCGGGLGIEALEGALLPVLDAQLRTVQLPADLSRETKTIRWKYRLTLRP